MTRFLFEYHFEGSQYALEIPAENRQEAENRVAVLSSRCHYLGEINVKLPASVGWLVGPLCWFKNLWR